jgi:hypothetical protein
MVATPEWFISAVAYMHDLYSSTPGKTLHVSWWAFMRHLPEDAIRTGFRRAVETSPGRLPTAPQIAEHAKAASKSLGGPVADLSRPALPEPELTLPPDSEWAAKLEAYKRGETPGREQVAQVIGEMVGGIG